MRSRSGHSISTLMLSLPLVGIPIMAVFGVPQFVPVVASSVGETPASTATSRPKMTNRFGESVTPTTLTTNDHHPSTETNRDERLDDLFRPSKSRPSRPATSLSRTAVARPATGSATQLPMTDPVGGRGNFSDLFQDRTGQTNDWPVRRPSQSIAHTGSPRANQHLREDISATNDDFVGAELALFAEKSIDGLTWRKAVERLNELGIRDFRLEPGRRIGEFYFACEFSPNANARVKRRFESEANEPLKAVASVLRQIDDWLIQR